MLETNIVLVAMVAIGAMVTTGCQKADVESTRTQEPKAIPDTISIGDSETSAREKIDAHNGLEKRIAYSKFRDGSPVTASPLLSFGFATESPLLMISLENGLVSEIELATLITDQTQETLKPAYDIENVDSFTFSTAVTSLRFQVGDPIEEFVAAIEQSWKHMRVGNSTYRTPQGTVGFDADDGIISAIRVDKHQVNSIEIPYLKRLER